MSLESFDVDVGRTHWNQQLKLTYSRGTDGVKTWSLHRAAANQRDDDANVYGLTDDNIMRMAAAVEARRKGLLW